MQSLFFKVVRCVSSAASAPRSQAFQWRNSKSLTIELYGLLGSSPAWYRRLHELRHSYTDQISIGKKQLNQLITLLDKEGGIRGNSRNADMALRSTRAKREADEAGEVHDIDYF